MEVACSILIGGDEDMLGTEEGALVGADLALFDVGNAAIGSDGIVREACP